MIDTYFDRCDAASGYRPTRAAPISEDHRYWCGRLFPTVIDRHVAEAKRRLGVGLAMDWLDHRHEMEANIKAGDDRSQFWPTGSRK